MLAITTTFFLLVPCVWQERIQAGDLASHVYNAWLAIQIKNGSVPQLQIAHPWTNVLGDWILEAVFRVAGPVAAERVAAGAAVLIFFWGAFYLILKVNGRRPWLLSPGLAMLAYGLVFNLGFLNFYLSTGIALWIMGLLWQPTRNRALASIPLWLLAILAHPMPVAWAAFFVAYTQCIRRLPDRLRPMGALAVLAAIVGIPILLMQLFPYRWSLGQSLGLDGALGLTGGEQVVLHGPKYLIVAAGLLAIWCALFLERLDQRSILRDPIAQIWLLQLVAYVVTPAGLQVPPYEAAFAFVPQRLSLFNAIILCVMVGSARYGRGITRLTALVATIYFTFLFIDNRAFNSIQAQVQPLIDTLPRGQRVVVEIADSNSRLHPLLHVGDFTCIGHCFSYSNYEPATAQFRIRAAGANSVTAYPMDIVRELEDGRHIVTAAEAPIYSVCDCGGSLCIRRLEAGSKTCSFSLPVSPSLNLIRSD